MAARQGQDHHLSKLTPAIVRSARKAYATASWLMIDGKRHPVNANTLARKYGVTHQTMRSALKGETWRHVT